NPQHVVSVPYSDAHKIRVCEYYPFAVLTEQELLDFHKRDLSEFVTKYQRIEAAKLQEAYDVLDSLSDDELKEFSGDKYKVVSEKDIDQLTDAKSKLVDNYNQIRNK